MEAKPLRRISEAPSARNLKPRRVSAVRQWPPGCGRSPPPSLPAVPPLPNPLSASCPSPSPPPPSLPATTVTPLSPSIAATAADPPNSPPAAANGDALDNDLEVYPPPKSKKDDNKDNSKVETVPFAIKRWMGSKIYPPPKRRSVSAVRHFPPGCGRAADFSLGLVHASPPQIESHPDFNEGENHDSNGNNKHNQNDGMDWNQNEDENDEKDPETGVPVEINEDRNSLDGDNHPGDDSESKIQELPVAKRDNSMENIRIAEGNPGDEGVVARKDTECEVVSMDEELLVNDAAGKLNIRVLAAVKQPKSEGLSEKMKKIKEKKKKKRKKKTSEVSDIKKPKSEQDEMLDVGLRQTLVKPETVIDSPPSKEIVVFSESVPWKDRNVMSSKGKEKVVVLKKKVVAKKRVTPEVARKHDNGTIISDKDTMVVPFQMCNAEDATTSFINEEIVPSQIIPSQSRLIGGTPKKKGRKFAKKSTRHANDDSTSAQEHDLMTLTLTLPPVTPSDGERLSSARSRVKKVLRLFQVVCRMLIRNEESGSSIKQPQKGEPASQSKSKGPNRIDLRAVNLVKKSEEYVDPGDPVVGHILGVEVGDEFRYRVELHLIGLHRPLQSGIDWTKVNGVPVATSIVASGGYSDGMDGSDVLNYTGAGGKPTGKKGGKPEDQKLERGNLALKNSMDMKTPVRVIHGLNTSDCSKKVMTFTYDGLYTVEEMKSENEKYKFEGQEYEVKVFRFRLRRMPGQPELSLHVATKSKRSKVREGLCVADISQGMEKIPICAINTVDDEKPPAFKYITNMIYPSWYEKTYPKGCDCTTKCSSSKRCLCAQKNGGGIPFNFSGAIVQAKQLIYECGPSCRCPNSCHNRVSQHGIKIPLEIFKTENRGWGVRSLSSIPSGSFVCEYVGELLQDEVAERRDVDEYLFDIGHNYDDADLWKGLPSLVPGIGCTGDSADNSAVASASEGLTIDAAAMGNVGRFINHCCSPNLYAQNVLFDHDDRRMPHIMFFAAENIPPLQELTYHYNYDKGQVRDSQGNVKRKKCYCGSLECEGWLY